MTARKLAWRQLLSDPPSSWMRLPMITRGVGDEILRAVDANGEIDCGDEKPAVVVCRLAAAHPRERRRIAEAVDELVAAAFLRLEIGDGSTVLCVQLPDLSLARAPEARSKRARSGPNPSVDPARTEPEPDANSTRTEPAASADRTQSRPEVEPKCAEPHESVPVEKRREEEKREENTREEHAGATGGVASGVSSAIGMQEALVDGAHGLLLRGYQERYERLVGDVWMGHGRVLTDIRACARWCAAKGPEAVSERVEALLEGMFDPARTSFAAERWPWAWVVRNPQSFVGRPPVQGRAREGFVALQAKPGEFGSDADYGDADIPAEPPPPKVIRYG